MIAAELLLALLALAAQGDQSPKGQGDAPSAGPEVEELGGEIKITVEEIKKHEVVLTQVAKEIKEAVTGGKDLRETIIELEAKYGGDVKAAKDPAAKRELSFALELLHQQRAQMEFERAAKVNPQMPAWVMPFANRAMSGGSDLEAVVAARGVFDGAGTPSGGLPAVQADPYFKGSLRSPIYTGPATSLSARGRVSREVINKIEDLKPQVDRTRDSLTTAREMEAAAAANAAERKSLESEIAKGKDELATLTRSVAAVEARLGALPANSAAITQEMDAIKRANDELLPKSKALGERKDALYTAVENRKATMNKYQAQIDADKEGFYSRNKADCVITRTEKQADGSERFWWRYKPSVALYEANERDIATWKQLDAQQAPMKKELDSHVERWNKLKEKRDAVDQKAKLARIDQLQKTRIERLDRLKKEHLELKARMARMLAELKEFARRMGEWVQQAKSAVQSVREGR